MSTRSGRRRVRCACNLPITCSGVDILEDAFAQRGEDHDCTERAHSTIAESLQYAHQPDPSRYTLQVDEGKSQASLLLRYRVPRSKASRQ